MVENSQIHSCENETCQLLNPSLERLLKYEDLSGRVAKAEKIFLQNIKIIDKIKSLPLGLFGWTTAHHIFQLLNIEFIQELAKKIKEINTEVILEVGAGDGLLGKYLSKESGNEIVLTDDYSWWDNDNIKVQNKNVIRIGYDAAIKKYNPDLIIASWIPYKNYWTKEFRECESVKGYILIGEGPGGCTGSDMDWETSWIKHDLDSVEKYSICRSDYGLYIRGIDMMRHTNVSFFERP